MPALTDTITTYETSAAAIGAFIEGLDARVTSFEGPERRAHARYVVAIPSLVRPLDDDRHPQGTPFNAATRDISIGGIGLIHTQPVTAKLLSVKLTPHNGNEITLLVKVVRCQPLGAYFDVAGEFVPTPE